MSAGVVILMVHNGKSRLVMGREQYVPGWRGSSKWSDFGGQLSKGETHAAAAAREFYEETLGVFGSVGAAIAAGNYLLRVAVRRTTANHGIIVKHLYVVQLPWDATAAQRFHGRREHLKHVLFTIAQLRRLQRTLSEMRLPVPDHLHKDPSGTMLVCGIDAVEELNNNTFWVQVRVVKNAPASGRYFGPFLSDVHHVTLPIPERAAELYVQMIELKNWLERLISAFPADVGAHAIAHKECGPVKSWLPFVRREFLEKDTIKAWELSDLAHIPPSDLRNNFAAPLAIALARLGTTAAHTSLQS